MSNKVWAEACQKEELAYLIEGDGCYWDGSGVDGRAFSRDPNKAVRFCRAQDADAVKHFLLRDIAFALRTSEHMWVPTVPHTPNLSPSLSGARLDADPASAVSCCVSIPTPAHGK